VRALKGAKIASIIAEEMLKIREETLDEQERAQ
jgi:hypothetical protein